VNNLELKNFASDVELAEYTAALWLEQVRKNPAQNVALSGGTISRLFFQKIAERAIAEKIFLSDVHFFWADERCVPPTDPESNFALANENLFSRVNIQPDKIHRLCGELEQDEAVARANHEIARIISPGTPGFPVIDIVFLGLGPDGHVASLFPNAGIDVLTWDRPFLSIEDSPKPPPKRITLSYAAIVAAKEVWVLISGAGKEKALRESISENGTTPLARILQIRQQTKIFTDVNFNDPARL
jgi:6-phosphogluconolactonase